MKTSPLRRTINNYLVFLTAEQGKSHLTVQNYQQSLEFFQLLCPITSLIEIDKNLIRQYKVYLRNYKTLQGKPFRLSTQNHHLVILRSFLRYCNQECGMHIYGADQITLFKQAERQVKNMSLEDLYSLFDAVDIDQQEGVRDLAMLQLLFSTGLRVAELCSLNRKQISLKTGEISVRGKRGKVRLVFISPIAGRSLERYLKRRTDPHDPLFIRHIPYDSKLPLTNKYRLSRESIYQIVKKYAKKAQIISNPSPHTFRHAFATDLLRNGADLRSVQELLGHSSISTTQIYTHVTNPQLKKVHKKYHGLK